MALFLILNNDEVHARQYQESQNSVKQNGEGRPDGKTREYKKKRKKRTTLTLNGKINFYKYNEVKKSGAK